MWGRRTIVDVLGQGREIRRHYSHKPPDPTKSDQGGGNNHERFRIEEPKYRPVPCASLAEFLALRDRCLAIAFLDCRNDEMRRKDPFFAKTPMFAGVSPRDLLDLHARLRPEHRTLSTIVMPN